MLDAGRQTRLAGSLEQAFAEGGGRAVVAVLSGDGSAATAVLRYGDRFGCHACELALERPQPVLFSFNHPLGACPECRGFGHLLRYDESRVVPDPSLSLADGAVQPWRHPSGEWYQKELMRVARRRKLDVHTPYRELPEEIRRWVQEGDDDFCGIRGFFEEVEGYRYKLHVRVFLSRYRSQAPCPGCRGARLKPEALAVTIGGRTIADVGGFTVDELAAWLDRLELSAWEAEVARDVRTRLQAKVAFLRRVGLGYLTLDRQTRTPLRRRGPADRARHPARRPARRHALRPRRAVDRAPRPGRRAPGRAVPGARVRRQHRGRRGARPELHRSGRLLRGARSGLG